MNNLKFRIYKDIAFKGLIIMLLFISITPLFLILIHIFIKGISVINFKFFLTLPASPGESGGGILNSILGSALLITISFVFSVPLGIMTGIFLSEVKNKFSGFVSMLVNLLQGIPSIVIGILAYVWIVIPMHHFSAFSGGIALSLMMLPMIIKSTQETLKLIPLSLKESSYALGVSYTRTILKVILPAAFGGITSGIIIGISRIAGETAPLLFTAFGNPFVNLNLFKPVDSLPLLIFNYSMSPYEDWHKIAWGASLMLILFILILNVTVKIIARKWKIQY